jgi:hypothetical protein
MDVGMMITMNVVVRGVLAMRKWYPEWYKLMVLVCSTGRNCGAGGVLVLRNEKLAADRGTQKAMTSKEERMCEVGSVQLEMQAPG